MTTLRNFFWQTVATSPPSFASVPLPEPGNSTPITWNEQIFLTQPVGDSRTLKCLNRADGKLLWQVGVATKEKESTHGANPYCPASPVIDGDRVIVSFAGDGLYCYDFNGKELWKRTDLGRQIHIWGNAASPFKISPSMSRIGSDEVLSRNSHWKDSSNA